MKADAFTGVLRKCRGTSDTWIAAVILALVGVGFDLAGEPLTAMLRYERVGLVNGEFWRLIGGHLVHLGSRHTAMNVAALCILAFVLNGVVKPAAWFAVTLLSALTIDAGLFWIDSGVEWYVGLSGVLHGLLGAGSLELWRRDGFVGPLLFAALVAKITWEQWVGPLPLSEQTAGGQVIVSAHLFGALGGSAWFALSRSIHALRKRPL